MKINWENREVCVNDKNSIRKIKEIIFGGFSPINEEIKKTYKKRKIIKRWTKEEINTLKMLIEGGASTKKKMKVLNRTRASINTATWYHVRGNRNSRVAKCDNSDRTKTDSTPNSLSDASAFSKD